MDRKINHRAGQIVGAALLLFVAGCVIIPTPERGVGQISGDAVKGVRVGETTRTDVLLQFGKPTRWPEDRVLCYEWSGTVGYAVMLIAPAGSMPKGVDGAMTRLRAYCLAFRADGVVSDTGLFREEFFSNRDEVKGARDNWVAKHSALAKTDLAEHVAEVLETPSIFLKGGPEGVTVSQGFVWVAYGEDSVARIDAWTSQVVTRVQVGREPAGVAIARDSIWVTNRADGTVSRIDALTHSVVATIAVGIRPLQVAASEDAIWVTNQGSGNVSRIDPQSNRTTASVAIGIEPRGIAVDGNTVWVTDYLGHKVVRIDAASNQIIGEPIAVGRGPAVIAVSGSAVWVANNFDSSVSRIDPRTNQVVATISTDGGPSGLVIVGNSVWISLINRASILKIDSRTNRIVGVPIRVAQRPTLMAVGEGAIWVSSGAAERLSRVTLQ
jgi:YVTN family beta-propeller protein